MSRIRLGLHRMSDRADEAFRDYVERVRPNVVKLLDPSPADEALAAWCRSIGVEVIGRIYFASQEMGEGGMRQITRILSAARSCPSIRYWELHNEAWQAGDELARYATFSIDFMRQIDALGGGRKAVIGCFSVGMPDLPDEDRGAQWRRYRPALEYAAAHGHLLGLHQYGGGSQGMRFDPPWYALRHRQVLAWAKTEGVAMPKILVTESGIDKLEKADRETRGWLTMPGDYDYAADMSWFCTQLAADPAIAGVVDFGFATIDPKWLPFDLSTRPGVLYRMAALQPAAPATPKPPKEEPPMPDLGAMLAAEFGATYSDLRGSLPRNPNGEYGDFSRRALGNVDMLAIHHTVGDRADSWQKIAQTHISGRGWAGIGYHIGIRLGQVAYLGDANLARACCADQNHRVLCVVLTGNYEVEQVDPADAAALRRVVALIQRWSMQTLGRPLKVLGHREVPGQATACPGSHLLPLVHQLAAGGATPAPVPAINTPALMTEADRLQTVRLNPASALQRAITRDGFVPTSDEFKSQGLVAQRAERLTDGTVRVYYVRPGDWAAVHFAERKAA